MVSEKHMVSQIAKYLLGMNLVALVYFVYAMFAHNATLAGVEGMDEVLLYSLLSLLATKVLLVYALGPLGVHLAQFFEKSRAERALQWLVSAAGIWVTVTWLIATFATGAVGIIPFAWVVWVVMFLTALFYAFLATFWGVFTFKKGPKALPGKRGQNLPVP